MMKVALPSLMLAGLLPLLAPAQEARPASAPVSASQPASKPAATYGPPSKEVVQKIDEFISNDPRFKGAIWGVVIESLATGEVWYEKNPDTRLMPASNMKIVTTASAFKELGPEFTFETTVGHTGTLQDGVIQGDLVVRGNGDPTLYSRFYDDPRTVFRQWAQQLKTKGITRIAGDIVGDDNAFDDQHLSNNMYLGYMYDWYAAPYGPLQINEGYVDFKIIPPATVDGEVQIVPNLPSSYYTVDNQLKVVPKGEGTRISYDRNFYSSDFKFTGQVEAGGNEVEESPTIQNPTMFYVTVLMEVLEEAGIAVDGRPVDIDDVDAAKYEARTNLITHQSKPLLEISTGLMKRSQNNYAETFLATLGWKRNGTGSVRGGGRVVEEVLEKNFGVDPDTYVIADGSGLSRLNLVYARMLAEILKGMWNSDQKDAWVSTMPIAGVDGTLRNRMKGTAAEGNVRAKTGTIGRVRGLSGYVTTAAGEPLVFSFLVNHYLASDRATEEVTDGVAELLANYGKTE